MILLEQKGSVTKILEYCSDGEIRDNENIAITAVQLYGLAFDYISLRLQGSISKNQLRAIHSYRWEGRSLFDISSIEVYEPWEPG